MARYPTRFARSPLAEAVFEMRFAVAPGRGVELLPGILLATLGKDFPRIEQMPLGTVPKEMRDANKELQYIAIFKLQGENESVLLGDRVASFNATKPYPGWSKFRSRAIQVATALKESGHAATVERYSLKYVNLIDSLKADDHPTSPFNLLVDAKPCKISPNGFRLRFETKIEGFTNIVECASNVTVTTTNEKLHGTMLTLDTIMEPVGADFWTDLDGRLNAAHEVLEGIYFELLTAETINAMGPSYD